MSKYAVGRFSEPSGVKKSSASSKPKKGFRADIVLTVAMSLMAAATFAMAMHRGETPHDALPPSTVTVSPAPSTSASNELAELRAKVDGMKAASANAQALQARVDKLQEDLAIADSRISALEQAVVTSDPTVSQSFSQPSK